MTPVATPGIVPAMTTTQNPMTGTQTQTFRVGQRVLWKGHLATVRSLHTDHIGPRAVIQIDGDHLGHPTVFAKDLTPAEHTHRLRYLTPNTLGLAASRGGNEPYVNVIMGRTIERNLEECRQAGCLPSL